MTCFVIGKGQGYLFRGLSCFLLLTQLTVTLGGSGPLSEVVEDEGPPTTSDCFGYQSSEEEEEEVERLISPEKMADNCELVYVDFEVYGTVQGVFFRKYTQKEAKKLGLRGFCRNTSAGTVTGSMEGARQAVEQMKHWLQNTGSPMSTISKAVFKNEKVITAFTFPDVFDIARSI